MRVYPERNGVECRACGATFASPDERGPFCGVCMDKFRHVYGKDNETDENLNKWLARQLELQLIRMKRYGFVRKCECITKGNDYKNAGYQCPCFANLCIDGRYMCKTHRKSATAATDTAEFLRSKDAPCRNTQARQRGPVFIEEWKDQYQWLEEVIFDLCSADDKFKESVLRGVKGLTI